MTHRAWHSCGAREECRGRGAAQAWRIWRWRWQARGERARWRQRGGGGGRARGAGATRYVRARCHGDSDVLHSVRARKSLPQPYDRISSTRDHCVYSRLSETNQPFERVRASVCPSAISAWDPSVDRVVRSGVQPCCGEKVRDVRSVAVIICWRRMQWWNVACGGDEWWCGARGSAWSLAASRGIRCSPRRAPSPDLGTSAGIMRRKRWTRMLRAW